MASTEPAATPEVPAPEAAPEATPSPTPAPALSPSAPAEQGEGAPVAPEAQAGPAAGRPGGALKWRIDVEDYVSEDNASVIDSIIEDLHGRDGFSAEKAAADAAAAATPAEAPTEATAATASTEEPSPAPEALSDALMPATVGPGQLSQLYSSLKEARDRPAGTPEEQERKAREVAMLQAALKEARARTAPGAPEAPYAGQQGGQQQAGTTELGRMHSTTSVAYQGQADGTQPMRRVASEGPVHPQAAPQGADVISGYGALSRAPSQADARSVADRDEDMRRATSYHERAISRTSAAGSRSGRHGGMGDTYRGPPPGAASKVGPRDPRYDARATVGFSEAQVRAMGLIQGPTTAVSEPRAEDVAHMTWKAGVSSRAPSVAGGRGYAPSMRGDAPGFDQDDSASMVSGDAPWDARSRGYGKSAAGSVYGGDNRSVYGDNKSVYGDNKSVYGDNKSVYGDNKSIYGDNKSVYGDNKSVYGDDRSVYGDASNAIVPVPAPVKMSPWRNNDMFPVYKGQEASDPIVDHSDAYSTVSGAYFRSAPSMKSGAPSEIGDLPLAVSFRGGAAGDSRRATTILSRKLGQLQLLGDEGVTMPDMPEESFDDAKSMKSAVTTATVLPPAPQPVGTVDIQMFNRLVKEMREEGENIQKLKQQGKLLQGWYADAKAWADEKSLRALEAMSIADDAEDVATMKHKLLKELDGKLQSLKERMAGITMLERENVMLRSRINQLISAKAPDSLLQTIKTGPRSDGAMAVGALLSGTTKHAKQDLEALHEWMAEMQEDGGQVERLKKLNRLLQGWYADANSRAEDAIAREREEFQRAKEAEELAAAGDLLILEMEAKHSEMRMKLAQRQMLEQENRELHSKLVALTSSKGPNVPVQKQQAVLLEFVKENLGFSKGRPVMACLVYKAMVHWSMIEVERLNTFDAVMMIQEEACKQANPDIHCYWLSNTVHMLFLATRGPTRIDSSVAKTQMSSATCKLYITIRDNVKAQMVTILNNLLQPPPVPVDDASEVGSVVSGATSTVLHKLVPSAGNVRRQMTLMWENVIGALRQLVDVLRANFVPPLVVRELLGQLLQFIDFKLFNAIMMHSPWVPCTLTNGETLDAGLADLEDWLLNVDDWLNSTLVDTISLTSSLMDNVKHTKQATRFLLDNVKAKRSLKSIQNLCPDLSMTQLAHICTWFEDDKEGLPGVEPPVIEHMWALMHEDQPFLLKEDKSCPFTGEEVSRSMREFSLDDIEPPAELRKEAAFHFLVPSPTTVLDRDPATLPQSQPVSSY